MTCQALRWPQHWGFKCKGTDRPGTVPTPCTFQAPGKILKTPGEHEITAACVSCSLSPGPLKGPSSPHSSGGGVESPWAHLSLSPGSVPPEGSRISGQVGGRGQTPHFLGTCIHLIPPAKTVPDPLLQTSRPGLRGRNSHLPLGSLRQQQDGPLPHPGPCLECPLGRVLLAPARRPSPACRARAWEPARSTPGGGSLGQGRLVLAPGPAFQHPSVSPLGGLRSVS